MELKAAADESEVCRTELLRLRNEKGRLSRLIGEARKQGSDTDDLVKKLKSVTAELKVVQKTAKEQLNDDETEKKWMPPQLVPATAIGDIAVPDSVSVVECDSESKVQAEDYVYRHPAASLWHRPVISSFIANTYGHKTRYLIAKTESDRLVGILPVVQINSHLFGNFMVSVPYFNYGGVLADNADIARKLVDAADSWRERAEAKHLEIRSINGTGLDLPQRSNKVTFWLPLPQDSDVLWNSFKSKLRAQIRRGDRELDEFEIGGIELLDDFYHVFSTNMRDLGTPVYGKDFFRNLLENLPGQTWVVVVRKGRQAVGCALLSGFRDRMEIPWASTLRRYSHTSVNMAMYWKILEFSIQSDFKIFDFGRCSVNAGTYKFKQQWGAQRIDLHWDYILPHGTQLPELNPDNPKFRLMIAIWRRLPLWIANRLGPGIVRMLP